MASCLTAPNPLQERMLIYHLRCLTFTWDESNLTNAHELNLKHVFGDYPLKITTTSQIDQWVKGIIGCLVRSYHIHATLVRLAVGTGPWFNVVFLSIGIHISKTKSATDCLTLTHWGRDKMDAKFLTTISNAFSWIKIYKLRFRFRWILFQGVQLTIFQHWFR